VAVPGFDLIGGVDSVKGGRERCASNAVEYPGEVCLEDTKNMHKILEDIDVLNKVEYIIIIYTM